MWFLSIIKIGDLRVRWNSKKWAFYGFSKYGKWLQICHLRNQIPLTVFAKSLAKEPCSLFLIFGLNYMYQAWLGARKCHLKVQVLPCLWVVLFYYAFGFPLSWTANCFSAEPWLIFLDKSFDHGCLESTSFMRYFVQKVPKTWRRNVPVKNKMPKYPYGYQSLFIISKKIFALENHCTHIVLVMWSEPESFESFFQES